MFFNGFEPPGFWGGAVRWGFAFGAAVLSVGLSEGRGSRVEGGGIERPPEAAARLSSSLVSAEVLRLRGTSIPSAQDDRAHTNVRRGPSTLELRPSALPTDWHEVVDKLGSFRISFPTQPKFTQKQMDTGAGRVTIRAYNLEEGPVSWVCSWIEFPPEYVRSQGESKILEDAKAAFFKRFKGKFLDEKIVRLGAAPGRDSTFHTEDDVRIRLKVFLRGKKLVQALAIAEPDMIDTPDVKRFFESLKWD